MKKTNELTKTTKNEAIKSKCCNGFSLLLVLFPEINGNHQTKKNQQSIENRIQYLMEN
jgi:hypothetical protein